MARPQKKPHYDAEKIMKELMLAVAESYEGTGELKLTAAEFALSPIKIRKLLITAQEKGFISEIYTNEIYEEVLSLYAAGKPLETIQEITGLGKSSINGYQPYLKYPYKPDELSTNADRTALYRRRKEVVHNLVDILSKEKLWEAIIAFQNYPFHTASGLAFSYTVKVGRDGTYNKELIVDRRADSKSLAWSSIRMAFDNALELRGKIIKRPKMLGDIRGISYVYPMLYRFGIIEVPTEIANQMIGKNPKMKKK